MSKESLFELINLSIDSLECGSVNFKALRSLLHGIVTHLFTETDAEDGSEEHAGREVEGRRPGRDKEAALEQQSGAPELPGEQMEDSAPEFPRGQVEESATDLPRGQMEDSAPELPRGQVEESAAELPRGQVEESAAELPRGQVEESAPGLPRGQVEESAAELPRGHMEESAAELPRGQVDVSALEGGQVQESASELPRGQVGDSAPELPRGQVEESATKVPVGQKEDRAKELSRGQVQDQEENMSEGSDLMQDLFKENQDLKEKTYSLKKEVESLQNQITQLVTLEHVQATLDCQKESIMKELKDYVSKTQLLDTSTEFVLPVISEEAVPEPLSQDLTQFNTGVETQKILMIVYQMRGKLDSFEARLRCLEGDVTTPVYSQQQSDPNSKGVLIVVNQLREKLDSIGARVKQIEGDIKTPLSSQQQIDPSSQGAPVDVNQLWEKLDSLEARVKQLEGDIGALLPSQQKIDPSSQRSLVDVDQLQEKLDSLEARMNHLESEMGAAKLSQQQTEPSSQQSLVDVNQLQEKLDSLEARMNHLEGERKKLLDQVNQLKAHSMSDSMEDRTMVSMTESLDEGTVDMSGSSGLGKELAKSETTESQSSDRFSGKEQQLHQADLRIAVQKLQKDMENMYRELLTSIEKQKGSIEKEIPVEATELTSDMQRVLLQLQARCDELHSTTTQLMKDHKQEKGHIKNLYKTTKELDENKADKEAINIRQDIKTDMEALEAKVHLCDTTANKLDKDHHDLMSIITDHEENCLKIDEIRSEIKLNVDPLRKQLKIFQMNFQKALDVSKVDDAAGFKKKLLTRYNCLSCDRAVDLQTPGPHLVVLPEFPNLPPSKIHKRLKKGTHFAKEPDTCALDKKVSEEYQDGMRSPINRLRASTGSIQKEKLWIPEASIP